MLPNVKVNAYVESLLEVVVWLEDGVGPTGFVPTGTTGYAPEGATPESMAF